MTSAAVIRSMRERFLEADREPDRYAVFAELAEAYVATTLEAISRIVVADPAAARDPAIAARIAAVRAKLEGLDDLIVRLRELQAEARD